MLFKITVFSAAFLAIVYSEAFAGGGGCDEYPCPPPPSSETQVACKVSGIEFVHEKAFRLDKRIAKFANEIRKSGFKFFLQGDEKVFHYLNPQSGRFNHSHWDAYHGEYPNNGAVELGNSFYFYTLQSGTSENDPRPWLNDFFIQVRKHPKWETPRLRFFAVGYFNPNDPWKRSGVSVLGAYLKCVPAKQ